MAIDPAVAAAVAATGRGQKAAIKRQGNNLNNVTTQNGRQGIVGKGGNFQPLGAAALGRMGPGAPGKTPPTRTPPIMDPTQRPINGGPITGVPPREPVQPPVVGVPSPGVPPQPGMTPFMPPPLMTFNGAPGAADFANAASGAAGGAGNIDNAIGALKSQLQQAGAPSADGSSGSNVGGPNTRFPLNPGGGGGTPWTPQINGIGGSSGSNMGGPSGDQAPVNHGGGNLGNIPNTFNTQPVATPVAGAPTGAGSPYLSMLKARLAGGGGGSGGNLSGLPPTRADIAGGQAGGRRSLY